MSLLERMSDDVKRAMKAGEKKRVGVLRMVLSELKRRAIDERAPLDEAAELEVLQRALKQRREASEAFARGGRPESAATEEAEAEIVASYLPEQLDDEQLAEAVRESIAAVGASSAKDMGRVMGRLLGKYKGRLEGNRAREAVQAALS